MGRNGGAAFGLGLLSFALSTVPALSAEGNNLLASPSFLSVFGFFLIAIFLAGCFFLRARKLERLLDSREKEYRKFSLLSSVMMLRCDSKGACIYVNELWEERAGQRAGEALGHGWLEPVHPEDRDRVAFEVAQAAIDIRAAIVEFRMNVSSGRTIWILGQSRPEPCHAGEEQCFVWIFTDISHQKRAEQASLENYLLLQALLENIPVPVFFKDCEGRYLGGNAAFGTFFEREKEDFIGKTVFDLAPYELAKIYHAADLELFSKGANQKQAYESDVRLSSGETRHVIFHKATFAHHDGTLGGIVGIILDITELKEAENALRQSEARLALALKSAKMGCFEWDIVADMRIWDDNVHRIIGTTRESFNGSSEAFLALMPEEDRASVRKALAKVAEEGASYNAEYRVNLPDGSIRNICARGEVQRDDAGRPLRLVGVCWDVTEQKMIERKLRQSESRYRELFEKMTSAFACHEIILDPSGKPCDYRFLQVNPEFERITGLHSKDILGKTVLEVLPGTEPYWIETYGDVALSGYPRRFENYAHVLDKHFEIFSYSPEPGHFATIFNDITERKQAELERHQIIGLLSLLNMSEDIPRFIRGLLSMMKEWSGCEAVGVRLRDGEDFPYYETDGFSRDFLFSEKSLCAKESDGSPIRDSGGNLVLECLCGAVLRSQADPSMDCFTESGSFWCNSSAELLSAGSKRKGLPSCNGFRGRCCTAGYESMALVPLRLGSEILGLLQFNDKRGGLFPRNKIAFFEYMAGYAAIGLSHIKSREELKNQRDRLDELVALRTAELCDSLEKLSAIDESSQIGVIIFQQEKVLHVNAAICAITGYEAADLYTLNPARYLYQDCREALSKAPASRDGAQASFLHSEFEILCKDQRRKWVDGFAKLVSLGGGEALLVTLSDITARKLAEEEMIRGQERLHLILQASSDGTWELELENMLFKLQPRLLEKLGYDPKLWSHVSSDDWLCRIHPQDKSRIISEFEAHIAGQTPVLDTVFRLERPDGDYLWLLIRATLIRSQGSGKPLMLVGSAEDISEHRRRDELKEQLEFQQILLDSLPIPVAYRELSGRYIGCNKAMLIEKELNREELIGKTDADIYGPELPELNRLMRDGDDALLASGGMAYREVSGLDSSGIRRSILLHKAVFYDKDGNPTGFIEASIDLTELRMTEAALRESELRLNSILNAINELIFYVDEQLRIVWLNKAACKKFGVSEEAAVGKCCHELFHCKPSLSEICPKGLTSPPSEIQSVVITPEQRIFEVFGYPVRSRENRSRGLVMVALEITDEQKAKEEAALRTEQLMQADKLKTLGILVAGVAHEINNPNNFIMLNIPLLKDTWKNAIPILAKYNEKNPSFSMGGMPFEYVRSAVDDLLDGIEEGAVRIREIVQNLKDYAKQSPIKMNDTFEINQALKSSLAILANFIKMSTDKFSVSYGEGLPPVRGDIRRIEQVIINIVQNACEALPSKKSALSVSTCFEADSGMVVVLVSDEGKGMDEDELKHVFDPFFTTKRDKGGTGLGLSVSHTIIEEHQGWLQFSSEPGYGTLARISLPPADKEVLPAKKNNSAP